MAQLSPEEWENLAEKWLHGSITPDEKRRFDQWYEQEAEPRITLESIDATAEAFRIRLLEKIKVGIKELGQTEVRRQIRQGQGKLAHLGSRRLMQGAAVAASLLIVVLVGWLWTISKEAHPTGPVSMLVDKDIQPGKSGAILTLAGGQKVMLDSTIKGMVSSEGNSSIFNKGGQLVYTPLNGKPAAVQHNTLTTGRGNEYQLILPDGTKVWLNAASSLTYPTAFTSNQRTVTLTGQAYFEVAHRDHMPFKVEAAGREIEDLGTRFDVNAYADESPLTTTLLEGSVRIGDIVLTPGQQAGVNSKGQINVIKDADIDQAVAWKNGLFQFDHADLQTVMTELGRWYNVDIRYMGKLPSRRFGGKISRFSNASDVLKVLELSQVHFRIEHRTIIVLP